MKHQMILVVHSPDIMELMKFQQKILDAAGESDVMMRKVEIKPLDVQITGDENFGPDRRRR